MQQWKSPPLRLSDGAILPCPTLYFIARGFLPIPFLEGRGQFHKNLFYHAKIFLFKNKLAHLNMKQECIALLKNAIVKKDFRKKSFMKLVASMRMRRWPPSITLTINRRTDFFPSLLRGMQQDIARRGRRWKGGEGSNRSNCSTTLRSTDVFCCVQFQTAVCCREKKFGNSKRGNCIITSLRTSVMAGK